ncbi:hypothetical protein F5146DRAFT_1224235 [Armillaria mellea]|nr:hypothetical protein F5146DRAFT_1224235 [Armillaria mellea]
MVFIFSAGGENLRAGACFRVYSVVPKISHRTGWIYKYLATGINSKIPKRDTIIVKRGMAQVTLALVIFPVRAVHKASSTRPKIHLSQPTSTTCPSIPTMSPVDFRCNLNIKHIGTASAILEIDGVNLLTDPFFSPRWCCDLPPIDAVLLSHEDHPDNLDELGRRLLDGRKVITTMDGARKLHPRPGVRGIRPWETVPLEAGGKHFQVTGTPCRHLPGGECTGFIITAPKFGSTDGLPNAIYFSGFP